MSDAGQVRRWYQVSGSASTYVGGWRRLPACECRMRSHVRLPAPRCARRARRSCARCHRRENCVTLTTKQQITRHRRRSASNSGSIACAHAVAAWHRSCRPATRQRTAYVTTFLPHRHRHPAAAGRQRATRLPRRAHGLQHYAPDAGISAWTGSSVRGEREIQSPKGEFVEQTHDPARSGERPSDPVAFRPGSSSSARPVPGSATAVPLACVHSESRRDALVPHAGGGRRGWFRRSGRAHADPVRCGRSSRWRLATGTKWGAATNAPCTQDAGDGRGAQAASDAGATAWGLRRWRT
jgi:hypothetical protein